MNEAIREAAIRDVVSERRRQQEKEGFSFEHDDDYWGPALAYAAMCYIDPRPLEPGEVPLEWPWPPEWWKPKSRRRDLVRAAALAIAEIERLDREDYRKRQGTG